MSTRSGGFSPWLLQRLSAILLAGYFGYLLVVLLTDFPVGYDGWRQWFSIPWFNIATGLFTLALIIHAWVGVRDVIMDYVKPASLRLMANSIIILVLAGSGITVFQALLRVGT